MLRITHAQGHDSISTLRLEGKFLGPWVTELARSCNGLRSLRGTLDRPAPAWARGGVPVTPFQQVWRINNHAYDFLDGGRAGRRRRCSARAVGPCQARTRRALPEMRQGLRGLSAPVRLLLHPLPDAAGRWQKGPRQGSAALRRLPGVLQELFDPVCPPEPPRP